MNEQTTQDQMDALKSEILDAENILFFGNLDERDRELVTRKRDIDCRKLNELHASTMY